MNLSVEKLVYFDTALHQLLDDPDGPVGKDLQARAELVTAQAGDNASGISVAGASNPEGRGPNIITGNLQSSIRFVIVTVGGQMMAQVGTDVFYGYLLETGLKNGATYPFLEPALVAAAS